MMQLILILLVICSISLTCVVSENAGELITPPNDPNPVKRLQRVAAINEDYIVVANADDGGQLILYKYEVTEDTYMFQYINKYQPINIELSPERQSQDFGESLALNKDNFYVAGNVADMLGKNGTAYAGNFKDEGDGWSRQMLWPDKRADDFIDSFGRAVAISDDKTIAIGAPDDDHRNGSVYIFGYEGISNGWKEKQKITVPKQSESWFGYAVSITSTHLVVGAPLSQLHSSDQSGFVYIYTLDSSTDLWHLNDTIKQEDYVRGHYGAFLTMHDTRIFVGSENYNDGQGCVFIYMYNGTNWLLEQKLVASNPEFSDGFGWSASVYNDTMVIGTRSNSKAYLFKKNDGRWKEISYWRYTQSNPTAVGLYKNALVLAHAKGFRLYDLNKLNENSSSTSLLPYSLFSYLVFAVLYLAF